MSYIRCVCGDAVPVKEMYFVAPPSADDEPSVNYFYYATSNETGSRYSPYHAPAGAAAGRVYSPPETTMSRGPPPVTATAGLTMATSRVVPAMPVMRADPCLTPISAAFPL